MTTQNVRQYVVDQLSPLLPASWKWFRYWPTEENRVQVAVLLAFDSYSRNSSAPMGPRLATFKLTLVERKAEPGKADDSLDAHIMDLLDVLDETAEDTNIIWTNAERVVSNNQPAFDITLSLTIGHINQETP